MKAAVYHYLRQVSHPGEVNSTTTTLESRNLVEMRIRPVAVQNVDRRICQLKA